MKFVIEVSRKRRVGLNFANIGHSATVFRIKIASDLTVFSKTTCRIK